MKLAQIYDIVNQYEELINLVKNKIKVMSKINYQKYNIENGIEKVTFEDSKVYVEYDDGCCGSNSTNEFNFDISWLTKTDEELEELANAELKEIKKRQKAIYNQNRKEDKENEYKTYLALKDKFKDK